VKIYDSHYTDRVFLFYGYQNEYSFYQQVKKTTGKKRADQYKDTGGYLT